MIKSSLPISKLMEILNPVGLSLQSFRSARGEYVLQIKPKSRSRAVNNIRGARTWCIMVKGIQMVRLNKVKGERQLLDYSSNVARC